MEQEISRNIKHTIPELIERRKVLWNYHQDINEDKKFVEDVADLILSDLSLWEDLVENPEYLIELTFTIVSKGKNRKTVPFFLNSVQNYITLIMKKAILDFRLGKRNTLKFRCLKGRQQGVTAFITAYQLACTLLTLNFSGFTMADKQENAAVILNDKGKYPFNNLPEKLKPHTRTDSKNEITFDKLNSSWRIDSASAEDAGRSRTINFIHLSERAYFPNYRKTIAALDPTITEGAIVFEETTANGWNDFRDDWFDKDSDFINIFVAWWLSSEYSFNFESEEIREEFISNIDNKKDDFFKKLYLLREKEGLNENQLYWYYNKRKTLKDDLEQEYPCNEHEAFLASGRGYFDKSVIQQKLIELANVKPIEFRYGYLSIFDYPEKDEKYYIGADVAEGLEEGDSSHAYIARASDSKVVAFIRGKFSPDRYGDVLVDTAIDYNNAFLGIEANNHGHSVIATVYRYRRYKNIYIAHQMGKAHDKKERSKKLGWQTTETTKYLMLDELDTAIRENDIDIPDVEFFEEALKVTIDEKGKVSINGKDRVAAAGILWQMRKYHNRQNNVAGYYDLLNKKRKETRLRIVTENETINANKKDEEEFVVVRPSFGRM